MVLKVLENIKHKDINRNQEDKNNRWQLFLIFVFDFKKIYVWS